MTFFIIFIAVFIATSLVCIGGWYGYIYIKDNTLANLDAIQYAGIKVLATLSTIALIAYSFYIALGEQ